MSKKQIIIVITILVIGVIMSQQYESAIIMSRAISVTSRYTPLITAIATAVMAGATIVLVIITGYYAHQTGKYVKLIERERKDRLLREAIDKVLKPLRGNLAILANFNSYGYRCPEFKIWRSLKVENPMLVYILPDNLRERLDNFLESYDNYFKRHWMLVEIVKEICKRVIQKYGISGDYDDIEIHFPELTGRSTNLPHTISYLYFIFGEINAEDFLKEYANCGIKTAEVRFSKIVQDRRENIISQNWDTNKIAKLIEDIKDEFKNNREAQEVFELQKKIRNKADKLKNEIEGIIEKWSKYLAK